MSLWQQNYDRPGTIWLSSLIASLPILFFFFALIKLKLKGYLAATYTVAIALLVALFFYKMPVDRALASVVYGFFYGLWPIACDHHRRRLCLQNLGQNRAVRYYSLVDSLYYTGPAFTDADCRFLLRGVP
jgi:hypothetical protein